MAMNCEEFRKAVDADPSYDGGGAHLAGCAACRAYQAEMLALDARILRALAVDVPEAALPELPAIDTAGVTAIGGRRARQAPAWLALAAALVAAAFLGLRMLDPFAPQGAALADQILAHLPHEAFAVRVTDEAVSYARLGSVVANDVAQFDRGAALITYAQSCEINGKQVPHLVMQGESGPVVIILMPEEGVPGPLPFGDGSVDGVILPVGSGSIAIIGAKGQRVEDVEREVLDSITWQS